MARKAKKAWGGRFKETTHKGVEEFQASIGFDYRLYRYDIRGSIAHCNALAEAGIITSAEEKKIIKGLRAIEEEITRALSSGRMPFASDDEDIHMAIERRLIQKIGEVGGKLHTGRSRNDQVALDLRLYLRDETRAVLSALHRLQQALVRLARKGGDAVMPGYTHLQRAQPILFSQWPLAYFQMLERDVQRLTQSLQRTDTLPLGSGALAGVNYPIDRSLVARSLGFQEISQNSLDAVSDRDFILEFLSASALVMMHLSRLSEEVILWSSQEFSFLDLPDNLCTGSSLMPQKKNPDVPELIRAKSGRVYASLFGLLTVMKGLPLAYNKDLQEDKEPLFDAVVTVRQCLEMTGALVEGLRINQARMRAAASDSFLLAADLADYLVGHGVAFRSAHEIVGRVVRYAIDHGQSLDQLDLKDFRRFSPKFGPDLTAYLDVQQSVARKSLVGGTAPEAVHRQIEEAERTLKSRARNG